MLLSLSWSSGLLLDLVGMNSDSIAVFVIVVEGSMWLLKNFYTLIKMTLGSWRGLEGSKEGFFETQFPQFLLLFLEVSN